MSTNHAEPCDFNRVGRRVPFGTWVWRAEEIGWPEEVLRFLVPNGVNEIYLVYAPGKRSAEEYRTFVRTCRAAGVRVALIGADARWVLPEGRQEGERFFAFYEDHQRVSAPEERFYGLHLDIEPHQLPAWETDNATVVAAYRSFLLRARQVADRTGTALELDIPCWFDRYPCADADGRPMDLTEFCIRHADTTLFMSYRDTARGAVEFARTGLALAERLGRRISLAFETGRIYEEINITFDHIGTVRLCEELHALRRIVETEWRVPEAGYAVHHYNSWSILPPHGNPLGDDFPYDNPNYAALAESKKG